MSASLNATLNENCGHFFVKKIRVLFGKNVKFLRRFYGDSIERQSDMDVVDEIDDPVELLVYLRNVDVDVIFLSMEHSEPSGLPSHLFAEYPTVTLVIVNEDCRAAYIENLSPHRIPIPDVSPDGILSAMRLTDTFTSKMDQIHAAWRQH